MTRLGVQTRDLRLLDNHLGTASALLCRENAIVISLSFIKAIITTEYILIVSPEEERSIKFMAQLKARLAQTSARSNAKDEAAPRTFARSISRLIKQPAAETAQHAEAMAADMVDLPFELKALEICFDEVRPDPGRACPLMHACISNCTMHATHHHAHQPVSLHACS